MKTKLLVGSTLSLLSGLTWLSYSDPEAYACVGIVVMVGIVTATIGCLIWEAGAIKAFSILLPLIGPEVSSAMHDDQTIEGSIAALKDMSCRNKEWKQRRDDATNQIKSIQHFSQIAGYALAALVFLGCLFVLPSKNRKRSGASSIATPDNYSPHQASNLK